ncbi:MAG TPA: SPOR domain-containing protein [Aestuariivirgaceae bacterium]
MRIPLDDPKGDGTLGFGTSAFSWLVVIGGVLLAVVGVVQAARGSGDEQAGGGSVAESVLNQQIDQLKAELDKERAEKTELIDKMAAAEGPAQKPAPSIEANTQTAVAAMPVPQEGPSLPEAMAPSAELMLSGIPVGSDEPDAKVSSFGIHLASFADRTMAERGWNLLKRNHPGALGKLTPRIDEAKDENGNSVFLLVAGPFESEALAAAHCKKINTQVVFCKPRAFRGSEVANVSAQ